MRIKFCVNQRISIFAIFALKNVVVSIYMSRLSPSPPPVHVHSTLHPMQRFCDVYLHTSDCIIVGSQTYTSSNQCNPATAWRSTPCCVSDSVLQRNGTLVGRRASGQLSFSSHSAGEYSPNPLKCSKTQLLPAIQIVGC